MNDCNTSRVVTLVDMDCFYCQVEVQHDQSLAGKPVAVVQYNSWKGGGIIAVNYEARDKGVNRYMRGDEAVQKCPDLNIVRVKEHHGKADLSKYRTASQKVFEVLSEFSSCVQRASIDEAYIDLTSLVNDYILSNRNEITEIDLANTFVEGYSNLKNKKETMKSFLHDVYNSELQDSCLLRLTIGAMLVEKLRESIFKKTGFRCSAGIANNKILAKLACGLHKPNQQTLLPFSSVPNLFKTIPIKKIKNLGGKLGIRVQQELNCTFMSDLAAIALNDLQRKFDDKVSNFLYKISRGIDNEPVESRILSKSIGSCKSFPSGLKIKDDIRNWLSTLINDIVEKLEVDYKTNKRKATLMTVSVRYKNSEIQLPTSQCDEITTYNNDKLLDTAYSMLRTITGNQNSLNWKNPITFLGVSIGKFVRINIKSSINNYFNKKSLKEETDCNIQLSKTENGTSCFETQDVSEICNDQKSNSNNCIIKEEGLLKKQNSNVDLTVLQSKTETNKIQQEKSFFIRKMNISSPVKDQMILNTVPIENLPSVSSKSLIISKNEEIITPTVNIQNSEVKLRSKPLDSFFSKKLEIISPSKSHINYDSIPVSPVSLSQSCNIDKIIEDNPTNVFCEKCKKMIDIYEYDIHIDNHFAMELSKSLNVIEPVNTIIKKEPYMNTIKVEPKKKTNKTSKKRKHKSNTSGSFSKKKCENISLYFKPESN